jgi:tetratricopeptide (TPR) repeat protein
LNQKNTGLRHLNKLLVIILATVLLAACTTQKKRSELSTMGKLWHNTTAHYNGYFNAREIVDNSFLELSQQHEDNYLELLEVYPYAEINNPQAVSAQVDEALKKVTVVINLHPYSQWSDDCYFLAGQAFYLKQDYEGAEKAFRFLLNEYPPEGKEEAKSNKSRAGKSSSGRSGKSKRSDNSTAETNEDPLREKPLTAKERERARRAYNKEVARRKKQRERDRRKGISAPRQTPTAEEPKSTEPATEPVEASTNEPAAEPARTGLVRLSEDPANAVDADPDGSFLKHRPAFQEGQLWLARTLIERDNYDGARRLLDQLANSPGTFPDVRRDAAVAQAHLAIQEEKYAVAAQALNNAVDKSKDKEERARLLFIKAQLHQQVGQSGEAFTAYEQVVRLNPDYGMEFAARLNMAQNAYLSGQGSATEAIANLEKLLNDGKNEPYHDQIYYAMAGIELAQGNQEAGVAYLEQCLASPSSNQAQQTEAYYKLGMLFYERESYLEAKNYFDNALQTMSKLDERYLPTQSLRDNLVDIARNLETIALQDSLLRVAEMSPEEQAELARQMSEQQKNKSNAAVTTDKTGPAGISTELLRGGPGGKSPGGATTAIRRESSFFAYDERTLKRGEKEFARRWGGRTLEDNWRRTNRSDKGLSESEELEVEEINLLTQEQIDKLLADVPKDNSDKERARLEIKKAMYELGRLYRDRLSNNEKSVAILSELDQRYPGNIHELDSWYYLYLGHTDLNNTAKAKEYYDKIIQKYPTSSYGQILLNPNYAQEFLNEERQLNRSYDEVYLLFEQGEYQAAITQSENNLGRLTGKHPLKPRYALLMAMSKGNTEGKEAYIAELQKVIASYPSSPEETRAKEILRLLGGAGASLPGKAQEESGSFKVDDNELHYVIVVFESDDIDLNANKIIVSDYNRTYHSLDKLRISNVYLGQSNDIPVLVLRRFKDKVAAMAYYSGIQKNAADFINAAEVPFQVYPITQSNYREILRNRTVEGYGEFFDANY